jgi:hypothetical protein
MKYRWEMEKNSKPAKRALRLMAANEPAKSFHSPLAKGRSRGHNQEKSTSSPAGITRPSVAGSNAPRDKHRDPVDEIGDIEEPK